jgi:hypothetical protein
MQIGNSSKYHSRQAEFSKIVLINSQKRNKEIDYSQADLQVLPEINLHENWCCLT